MLTSDHPLIPWAILDYLTLGLRFGRIKATGIATVYTVQLFVAGWANAGIFSEL
jgi:hypothetical protein